MGKMVAEINPGGEKNRGANIPPVKKKKRRGENKRDYQGQKTLYL